ncbi:MAG TPA: hypothetical protein DCE18_08685 [Syntrophobacteraceae bacterium]|nr:hypothetical protein [Syntrophobacteraceae bacterium]
MTSTSSSQRSLFHASARSGERFYRERHRPTEWVVFRAQYQESDLWIRAERDLRQVAQDAVLTCRRHLQDYIDQYPAFLHSLQPLPDDQDAPPVVREMLRAACVAAVGPMAAVAGAIAQEVGQRLKKQGSQVIVENGGDCYLDVTEDLTMAVYAGPRSPFSNRLGLRFTATDLPLGVCTSSGTIGHSLSFGRADAVTVVAPNAALADAAATRLGNMVQDSAAINAALELAPEIPGLTGTLILLDDRLGVWGNLELIPLHG